MRACCPMALLPHCTAAPRFWGAPGLWGSCRTLTKLYVQNKVFWKYPGPVLPRSAACPSHTLPCSPPVLWALLAVLDIPRQCQAKQGQERCLELSGTTDTCLAWAFCQH